MWKPRFPTHGIAFILATFSPCTLAAPGVLSIPLLAQVAQHGPSPASETAMSRAEREAEQQVSLSADKIIAILREEPGLLLEVKKTLVRKAYEQGRLLDPEDLTDEALFRLIGRDGNIRVLITREIEDREYVRVKPTREELEREQQRKAAQTLAASAAQEEADRKAGKSQEDTYWSRHDRDLQNVVPPASAAPIPQPQQPTPQSPPVNDSRRAIERAQAQYDSGNYTSGLPLDVMGMQRISPDQLSTLLAARMTNSSVMSIGNEEENWGKIGLGMSSLSGSSANPLTNPSPSLELPRYGGQQFPQQASLQRPARPVLPPFSSVGQDQPILSRRPNPYADVPSLYDLYSQYSRHSPVLERFGTDVFRNGTGNFDELPMDMPVGPDYVLGPGDGLSIDLWGSVSQRMQRVVDREGRVALPEVGGIQVTGRTLGDVQHIVQSALRTQFRAIQADVSISRLRSIRVYVVGDVERPGAYDVSSLSTPLNALYQAGGPTSRGSLRILKHYRGKQLVEEVDVYQLLLHGVQSGMQRLQSGDTILVPPLAAEVTIQGMVRRPAIYELDGEKSLAQVLELAGGVLPSGTLRHIDVERIQAHESRTMLRLDIPENNNQESITKALEDFSIQDGDKVKISPIMSFADKTVYLEGHAFRPGKYAYQDGMKVTDLIKSYKDLLPEPHKQHAEIIRLKAPDYAPEVLAFNLEDALAGKDQDLVLKPFDTVRVFGRFDFEDPPVITVTGEVRDPGDHVTNGVTYLRDAIYLAGSTTPEARLDDAQIFRRTDDGKLKVLSVNLSKALDGDAAANILLEPKDRVFVHKDLAKTDPPAVMIEGEVARPGKYPLGDGMSAAGLVRLAGGLKRSAYAEQADLTRYMVEHGEKIIGDHETVQMAKALAGEPDTDVRLHDGDVLTIRQLAGWNDVGATITVNGEVLHPGTYGIQEGERLSSILARAGGLRVGAYPYGAILQRVQVRDLEEKNRSQLVRQIQEEGAGLKAVSDLDPVSKESAMLQWKNALEKLQNTPPAGRMVIHISSDMKRWASTPADIQVRAGDVIYIPKKPNFVMVDGAVYNPTAVAFKPGKSAGWYLKQAGGPTTVANKKATFVIRADGSVVGGAGGMFSGGVLAAALQPGDMVVVPDKAFGGGITWKTTLQVAQLVSAVGIAVQVAKGF
jgi:protein involved in polysaccharide export with SLBB domain